MSERYEGRRGFVIGDIHGCSKALEVLLENMQLTGDDYVVSLGDAIDRGPDSSGVLDLLLDVRDEFELIFILGNHEEMMLDALSGRSREDWLRHGGDATLESYGGFLRNVPDDHYELLDRARRYWEGPKEICVHANLEPGVELNRQRSRWLRWSKLTGQEFPHPSGKRIICGHSGVSYGAPLVANGWICLDTLAYSGGVLTALNLQTDEIIQSRESGEFRGGVYLHELTD